MEHERFEFKHVANIVDMAPSSSKMLQIGRRMDRTGYYPKNENRKTYIPKQVQTPWNLELQRRSLASQMVFSFNRCFFIVSQKVAWLGLSCHTTETSAFAEKKKLALETAAWWKKPFPSAQPVRLCPPPCVSFFKVLRTEVFMSVFLVRLNLKSSNVDHFIWFLVRHTMQFWSLSFEKHQNF